MRQNVLALILLGVIMIGVNSDGAAGDRKAAAKCRKPNGKVGQTKANGCGSNVCKKSGGGGAAWESCPLPASVETLQEEMTSIRTLLKEILKNLGPVFDVSVNNNDLLNELLSRPGEIPISMEPATTATTTTTTTITTKLSSGLKVVFELMEEFNVAKNFLMGTLPYLGKQYKITFEWFITGFGSGYRNIIHFTIGEDHAVYGDRTPGVWLYNEKSLYVMSAMEPTKDKDISFAAKTGIWMTMEISQYMVADNMFEFDFKIDGITYWTVQNTRAEAFADVKMFSGDNWFAPFQGKIRNFQVQTRND